MNPWPIYSHIKRTVLRTGKFPTNREIVVAFPNATLEEMREGIIEAELAYERDWKNFVANEVAAYQRQKKWQNDNDTW